MQRKRRTTIITNKDLANRMDSDARIVLGYALGLGLIPERHSRCYFFTPEQAKKIESGFTAARKLLHPPKAKRVSATSRPVTT